MAEYTRTETSKGAVQYRNKTDGNKLVSAESIPEAVKEELDIADPGTVIDSDTVIQGEGDGVVDADGKPIERNVENKEQTGNQESDQDNKTPVDANPYRRDVPTSEAGFGFPRKNGKTGDIFDVSTPHTHIRLVAGMPVPVSEKNYNEKTDAEIYDRLEKLKLV